MKQYKKEIIKLTLKEVLLLVFDLALPFYEADNAFRIPARKYKVRRENNRSQFLEKINYLKRTGLIQGFVEGKEKYIEITPKGLKRIALIQAENKILSRPESWDRKWRLVIFDVPQKHNTARDNFRQHLLKWNFLKVQESVYVFPFECTEVVSDLTSRLNISDHVLISISEIMQGEEEIIEKFLDKGILNKKDLDNSKPVTELADDGKNNKFKADNTRTDNNKD